MLNANLKTSTGSILGFNIADEESFDIPDTDFKAQLPHPTYVPEKAIDQLELDGSLIKTNSSKIKRQKKAVKHDRLTILLGFNDSVEDNKEADAKVRYARI